jgi:hypothetical protein
MLADGENKSVVQSKSETEWLSNIEVMTCSMRGGMSSKEVERRVLAGVNDRYSKC